MSTDTVERSPGWVADDSTFGARLALVRQRMGWSNVRAAARACGLPAESWRTWERDGVEPRRLVAVAKQIAAASGCSYAWLIGGPDALNGRRVSETRIVAVTGEPQPQAWPGRPVTRTRPIRSATRRPVTPVTVG